MAQAPTTNMQGIDVPTSSVNAAAFFANTRRKRFQEKSISSFAGLGASDQFTIIQSGIIAALDLHVSAKITATVAGATSTTSRWPYDLIKKVILTANGTTNLVSCSGAKLAAYRFMSNPGLTDRGVPQQVGGASVTQGTLSLASESWGLGQDSDIVSGSYDIELYFRIPLAADLVKLLGAVFGQTQATSLNVEIDWANASDLFVIGGEDTVVVESLGVLCEGIVFSIPYGPDGQIVIPNLSAYHKYIEYLDFAVGTGLYGSTLVGQGVGQLLNRILFRLWSDGAPVEISAANFGLIGWQYGGDQIPEGYNASGEGYDTLTGHMLRFWNEELYGTDLGFEGFGCLDFASQWLARDSVDESTATNLQLLVTPSNSLTTPVLEVVQETISAGSGMYGSSGT